MTDKRTLMGTAGLGSGLLDSSGNPIPRTTETLDLRALPLIDPEAIPGLPYGWQARLLNLPGQDPKIILYDPRSELHLEAPIAAHENIGPYVRALRVAGSKQSMGETPESEEGYRV